MVGDKAEAERKPSLPVSPSEARFWGLFEMYIMPIWKNPVSGNTFGVCGILTGLTLYSPKVFKN